MTHALLDFYPNFCPNCGVRIRIPDQYGREDWQAHAAQFCLNCQITYQYAETVEIMETATRVGGDLAR